jgi:predicted transcriptional regulator
MHVLGLRVWITATQPGASITDEQYTFIQMMVCDLLTVHQNYSQIYFAENN